MQTNAQRFEIGDLQEIKSIIPWKYDRATHSFIFPEYVPSIIGDKLGAWHTENSIEYSNFLIDSSIKENIIKLLFTETKKQYKKTFSFKNTKFDIEYSVGLGKAIGFCQIMPFSEKAEVSFPLEEQNTITNRLHSIGIYAVKILSNLSEIYIDNQSTNYLFGCSVENCVHTFESIQSLIHDNDQEKFKNLLSTAQNEGFAEVEIRLRRTPNDIINIKCSLWANKDEFGSVVFYEGFVVDITAQYQAQEELRNQAQIFRDLVNNVPGVVYQWIEKSDGTHSFTFVSDKLREYFSVEPENMAQIVEMIHPEDIQHWRNTIEESKRNGTPWNFEGRLLYPDGIVKWWQGRSVIGKKNQDEVIYNGIMVDITEKIESQKKMEVLAERLTAATESAQIGIYDYDLEKEIYHWDNIIYEMHGIPHKKGGLSQKMWQDLLTPEEYNKVRMVYENCLSSPMEQNFEVIYKIQWEIDGTEHYLKTSAKIMRNSAGTPIRMIGATWEMTDLILSRKEINESRKFLSAVAEAVPGLLYVYDVQKDESVYMNRSAAAFIGYNDEELHKLGSKFWSSKIYPDDQVKAHEHLLRIKNVTTDEVMSLEYRMIHGSGRIIWIESQDIILSRDDTGAALLVLGVTNDITHRKEYQDRIEESRQKAEQANKAKTVFLQNITHELRTPLNTILGYSQILAGEHLLSEQQQISVESIHRSGVHLLRLVNDIIDISRIEADKIVILPEEIILPNILHETVGMFRFMAEEKRTELKLSIDEDIPSVLYLDPKRLRQILINLIGNAIKFSKAKVISISVQKMSLPQISENAANFFDEEVTSSLIDIEFSVKDNGCGIEPEYLPRLTEPFFQINPIRDEGTGLGLSIVDRLLKIMGSSLKVNSAIGIGSEFSFILRAPVLKSSVNYLSKKNYVSLTSEQEANENTGIEISAEACMSMQQEKFFTEDFVQAVEFQEFEIIEEILETAQSVNEKAIACIQRIQKAAVERDNLFFLKLSSILKQYEN